MPRIRLNAKSVARLRAPAKGGRPVLYWDDGPKAVRGFGVLASGKTSSKSFIVQRDLPDGRTRRVTIAGVNEITLDAARKRAADLLMGMRAGVDPKQKASCGTLRTTIEAHRAAYAHLRPRSQRNYNSSIVRYLDGWLDLPLSQISRDMVEKRHKEIAADVEARHTKAAAESAKRHEAKADKVEAMGWTDAAKRYRKAAAKAKARKPAAGHATANGVMRALRLYWNFAKGRDPTLGPDNPVKLRKMWFAVEPRSRLVENKDLPKFYAAVAALPNPVQADYLRLLLFSGMRRRECAGLRWENIDLEEGVLCIPKAATKAKRELKLPMSDVVLDLLVARRALGNSSGFVFPANSGSGFISEPKFALAQVAAACGVSVSAHDLRRTFCTVAESADISPFALKALVNHALPKGVTEGYIKMTTDRLREPAQKVADKLKVLCGIVEPAGENVEKLKTAH
jgi:integrase